MNFHSKTLCITTISAIETSIRAEQRIHNVFFFSPNCSSSKATLAVINKLWNNQFLTQEMRSQCHFYQDIWSLPASPMLTHPPQIAVFQGQYILKKEHWLSRDQKESLKPHIGLILWLTVDGRKCRRNAHIKKKTKCSRPHGVASKATNRVWKAREASRWKKSTRTTLLSIKQLIIGFQMLRRYYPEFKWCKLL